MMLIDDAQWLTMMVLNGVSTFIENLIKSLDAVGTVVKTTLSSPE
jgi:hypothetical protein